MCLAAAPLALVASAVAAAGSAVSTFTAVQQQRYQAAIADRNAKMENEAARDALNRGEIEARRYQQEASQRMGAQRAALAANGIDTSYGNAAFVQADMARATQEDVATIRENSVRQARGFDLAAANSRAQANASRSAATGTAIAGVFDFGSTVLGGVQQHRRAKALGY